MNFDGIENFTNDCPVSGLEYTVCNPYKGVKTP